MVRKSQGDSDVRPVQMYGALTNMDNSYRPDSTNTNRSELAREHASEDDQSVRTMIVSFAYKWNLIYEGSKLISILYKLQEVNPEGYVQQVDPSMFYDRGSHMECDFDR